MPGIWTQTHIDNLKEAISQGVLTVTFSGPPSRTITYQSLGAMRALLAEMIADVAGQSGAKKYRLAATRKGTQR